jgi:hypothetical protein
MMRRVVVSVKYIVLPAGLTQVLLALATEGRASEGELLGGAEQDAAGFAQGHGAGAVRHAVGVGARFSVGPGMDGGGFDIGPPPAAGARIPQQPFAQLRALFDG